MALLLRNGDYVPDGQGGFQTAEGAREVLERVLWKLTIRRGSFPFLSELGSRLYQLGRVPAGQRQTLARRYVAEALADEDVTVTDVSFIQEEDRGELTLQMSWQGQELTATLEVEGLG